MYITLEAIRKTVRTHNAIEKIQAITNLQYRMRAISLKFIKYIFDYDHI